MCGGGRFKLYRHEHNKFLQFKLLIGFKYNTLLNLMKMSFIMSLCALWMSGLAVTSKVTFHEDRGGGGTQCTETRTGSWNKGQDCLKTVGNDEIAHVQVCGERCVQMWDNDSWRGRNWLLCNTKFDSCVSEDYGDGKVSSFKIWYNEICNVELCEHSNGRGTCCRKGEGVYNMNSFGGSCPKNDALSSIDIHGSCLIRMYQHSNFEGNAYSITGPGYFNYNHGFANDDISSYIIAKSLRRIEAGGKHTNTTTSTKN